MYDELQFTAERGEKAQRLLENEDLIQFIGNYQDALHAEEEQISPLEVSRFAALRSARRAVANFVTYLETEAALGTKAREESQGVGKSSIIVGG